MKFARFTKEQKQQQKKVINELLNYDIAVEKKIEKEPFECVCYEEKKKFSPKCKITNYTAIQYPEENIEASIKVNANNIPRGERETHFARV